MPRRAAQAVVGYVEQVANRVVEGWLEAEDDTVVALHIDGIERLRQVPSTFRPDAISLGWNKAKGFRFHPSACQLAPGLHAVQVVPIVRGVSAEGLPGVGVTDRTFDLEIPIPNLADTGLFEYLLHHYGLRPEIRRLLIADVRVKHRPDIWAGDVIFVDGLPDSPSSRYRVGNVQGELVALGFDCCTLAEDELWRIEQGKYTARVVHFFRTPLTGVFASAATAARAYCARIGFDLDDLVFDPAIMPYIDGLRDLSFDAIELYRVGMVNFRRFAAFADFVTTSTEYLAEHLRDLAAEVCVVPNSLAGSLFRIAYGQAPRNAEYVRIGYYAGTRTHQVDFAAAADALVRILRGYARVRIRLVGEIDLAEFPRLASCSDRIEQVEMLNYDAMLHDMACCDIIIAPLEANNPYCDAKSELKYFEAALTGAAVVASPTPAFREAIDHGTNGFLATTTAEWFQALVRLLDDPELLSAMNSVARDDVRRRYHAATAARRFAEVAHLVEVPAQPKLGEMQSGQITVRCGTVAAPLDIAFVVPPLIAGSGGQRKVLRLCYDLEQAGHTVTVYVTGTQSAAECRELITRHYYPFAGRLFRYNGSLAPHDFLVATAWETAYVVRRHAAAGAQPVYFVQDFEPMFMPVGTGYLKAFATYMFGFRTICLGQWVAERLRRELDLHVDTIPFTLDRSTYHPIAGQRRKNPAVTLFARPSQERRAFTLCTEALELLVQRIPSVHVGFFGEPDYPAQRFSFQNHGQIASPRELAELYRSSAVGICLSPTNPSLVAYEMLATGTPLVDLALPGAGANFDGKDVAYLAMPTPDGLADQIQLALQDDERRARRVAAGLELTSRMHYDDHMSVLFADFLCAPCQHQDGRKPEKQLSDDSIAVANVAGPGRRARRSPQATVN